MPIPTDLAALTDLFRRLGARGPENWARSQVGEGIPQLQRFLFLRQAWREIVGADDTRWIDEQIGWADSHPGTPYAGVGLALKSCLAAGASRDDIHEIGRGAQAQLLFALCYLLDDPKIAEPELEGFGWGLFQTDGDGNPLPVRIANLHESVLDTDPTGREMRPRAAPR